MEDKKNNNYNEDQEERAKKTIMLTGIIFFMILIIFIWSVNIKKVFKNISSAQVSSQDEELEDIKNDLDEVFDNLKYGMDQLNSEESPQAENQKNNNIENKDQEKGVMEIEDKELQILKEKLEGTEI